MNAIYKREVQSYFSSILGYIVVAVMTFFIALFFSLYNLNIGYSSFSYVLDSIMMFLNFAIPILTMRTFAEERRQKTDQLLFTSPVSVPKIVLAKYFSVMTVIAIPFLISCLFPIILSFFGNAMLLKDYCSIFAVLCICSLYSSIGIFISSLTDNQILAVFLTVVVLFILYLFDALVALIPETALVSTIGFAVLIGLAAVVLRVSTRNNGLVALVTIGLCIILAFFAGLGWDKMAGSLNRFLDTFSVTPVLTSFTNYAVFDIKGIFYLLSFTALFIVLTVQSIQKRRWN